MQSVMLTLPGVPLLRENEFVLVDRFRDRYLNPLVGIHVLAGGVMPKRQTDGAIGYDVSLRALVSPDEMDPKNPLLRRTLFNFKDRPDDAGLNDHVHQVESELVYRLPPGGSILGGVGFATAMPFPLMHWVAPRSGLASRHSITLANAPGTVDSDYRGEAGVVIHNIHRTRPFDLRHQMRIAQIVFYWAVIPDLFEVERHEELGSTDRGTGGFGSTGLR